MKPVDQEFINGNPDGVPGDCVRAATATLLNLPIAAVPHFVAAHGGQWRTAWERWLDERDLIVVELDPRQRPLGFFLAVGPTERTGRGNNVSHMIVMHGGGIGHDPHPSRAGLTGVERVYLIAARDPSRMLSDPRRAVPGT